jgi:hypothetical protein
LSSEQSNEVVALTKEQMRARAQSFAKTWATAQSEHADKQPFWDAFFEIFGVQRRQVAVYEALAQRSSTGGIGFIDLLLPGQLAVEHKSAGKSLPDAMEQLLDYLPALPPAEHPWLLVASDFGRFMWRNLDTGEAGEFATTELVDHLDLFWWLAGYEKPHIHYEDEVAANLAATELLAHLHDAVAASGYPVSQLREWLTRTLFCLFADDSGVWDRNLFVSYVALHSAADGHDLGDVLSRVFRVLDTAPEDRPSSLDEQLGQFTFISGDLFAENLWPVTGTAEIRHALLDASRFDWSAISPAIFGSLFQNVMSPLERRQLGAHYTTEGNIMRTIRPLFLMQLEEKLAAAVSAPALRKFHDEIANLTFLDPACGCGNFLVIIYRELRRLEIECLRKLTERENRGGQLAADLDLLLKVTVDQFYGIEIEEFPAKIARTALYLMDHLENRRASAEFGTYFVRFPIPAAPNIRIDNALRLDWERVVPSDRCNFVVGNPPFAGHRTRSREQSDDLRHVWGSGYNKLLDYVTGWFRKALDFDNYRRIKFGFVATNSIGQGEQVARLWQPLIDAGYRIDWVHQPFAWTSEARGKAHVHVVIVGFSHGGRSDPRLFAYATPGGDPVEERPRRISPYFVEGPNVAVAGRSGLPLSASMSPVRYGSLPSDGGGLIVRADELPRYDPVAQRYLRPYCGSKELVRGVPRWVIWMPDGPEPGDLANSSFLRERLAAVRTARMQSENPDTRALAEQPYRWFHNAQPSVPYIGIPAQVSENRNWYTVAYLDPEVIASNTLYTAEDPDGFLFGILSSSMFVAWVASIGGRLESRYRYSKSIVHNTFPLPNEVTAEQRSQVIQSAREVLAARSVHPGASLSDLYEPLATSSELVRAHSVLDRAVDRIFDPRKRRWDRDARVGHLLGRYVDMVQGEPETLPVDGGS